MILSVLLNMQNEYKIIQKPIDIRTLSSYIIGTGTLLVLHKARFNRAVILLVLYK